LLHFPEQSITPYLNFTYKMITTRTFVVRNIALIAIAAIASIAGALSCAFWVGALLALPFTWVFTFYSERLLFGKLFGKIGKTPTAWYSVHALGELLAFVGLIFAFGFTLNIHGHGTLFYVLATVAYLVLCFRSLKDVFDRLLILGMSGGKAK